MKKIRRAVEEIEWVAHPVAEGVTIRPLVTKKDDSADVTCMLVMVRKGKVVPEHVHERQDDILYPLQGKGIMWVDGGGTFTLEPGCVVRVPMGTKHKIENVSEDLLLYDVFWPAIF